VNYDLLIKQGQVVLDNKTAVLDIAISDEKIVAVDSNINADAKNIIDAKGMYVTPGIVDVHMHISEPGRTPWEGYLTGTQSMAVGGTTCFMEMPLNTLPATNDIPALNAKLEAAKKQCYVDYAPMGGLVPWNIDNIGQLADANVAAFKAFVATCGSDIPGDFKNVNDYELYRGMQEIAKTDLILIVHCENAAITDALGRQAKEQGKTKVSDYVATRPVFTEVEAVNRVLYFAEVTGCKVHIAHCSCHEAIEAVKAAQKRGVNASFESCPHYLLLATEDLDAIGNKAKCSPPIRNRIHQNKLWELLANDQIEMLASDHSPCTPDLKASSNAFEAWGGISGCQNSLDLMFAQILKRGIEPHILMRALAKNPAKRFGFEYKGEIAQGKDADLVIIDSKQGYTITAQDLWYKNKFSAYENFKVDCRITHTFVRGNLVYKLGSGVLGMPQGKRIVTNY